MEIDSEVLCFCSHFNLTTNLQVTYEYSHFSDDEIAETGEYLSMFTNMNIR